MLFLSLIKCPTLSEILYEDESFEERELSALVASKVYYHLGAYDEALHYALGAASLLDVNQSSEYVDTVVGECVTFSFIICYSTLWSTSPFTRCM